MKKIINLLFICLSFVLLCGCFSCKKEEKTPLNTPQNLEIQGTLLYWDSVENATGYTVMVNNQTVNCNESPFELRQLSLTDGKYYIMVKARGNANYNDSDFSMAIEYLKGKTNIDSNQVGNNNIDNSLNRSKNRYSPISSPMIDNAPPLIASSTDYTNNYYLIDGGYVLNTPISSGLTIYYNGQTPITVLFEKSSVTNTKVEEAMEKTISETVNTIKTGSADVNIGVKFEKEFSRFIDKLTVGADFTYSRQWGTTTENLNSTSTTYSVANEVAESISQSIEYTIGNHNEAVGDYRLSMVTTCDVYYLVTTNYNNTELIEISMT